MQTGNNLSPESLQLRAGCAIGGIKEPDGLRALEAMLASDTTGSQDMVVICIRHGSTEDPIEETDDATQRPNPERMVDDHVTDIFGEVVFSAEKTGKPVKLLALAGDDCIQILLAAAAQLGAANLWIGCSRGRPPDQQEAALKSEWQRLGPKRRNLCISLVGNDKEPARQLLLVA